MDHSAIETEPPGNPECYNEASPRAQFASDICTLEEGSFS